jgi:HEPN domain-containing protein
MDDKVKYWLELSDYDLETALAMLNSKRYLYVGFMCHQTIEKIFKSYYTSQKGEQHPIHTVYPIWQKKESFTRNSLKTKKTLLTR